MILRGVEGKAICCVGMVSCDACRPTFVFIFSFFCHGVVVPVSSSSSCLTFTIVVSRNKLAWRQSWSLVPSQSSSLTLGSVSPSQEKKIYHYRLPVFAHRSVWAWVNLSATRNKREPSVKKTHTIRGLGNSSSLHNHKIPSTYVIMRPLSLLSTRWRGINRRLMSLYWCASVTILIPCFGRSSVDHDFCGGHHPRG